MGLPEQMENYTDEQLALLIQQGDPDAFAELTARYLSFIRAKAHPFCSSILEADDLCQEGLLGLFAAAKRFSPVQAAGFKTYAGICIQNRMVAAYRACARKKNVPAAQTVPLCEQEDVCATQQGGYAAEDPETLVIDRENAELIYRQLRQHLSQLEQQALFGYLSGRSYHEIAARLSVSAKSVDNAIARARRKLQVHGRNMPR